MLKTISVALAILVLANTVSAFELDAPNPVYIFDSEKEITLTIKNTSNENKDLRFAFYAPVKYEIDRIPLQVNAQSYQIVKIKFYPDEKLVGSSYSILLSVALDEDEIVKNMKIYYRGELPEGTGYVPGSFSSGFFSFAGASLAGSGLLVDIILVIIAAVLLIAFISRYTKRMQVRQ